MQERFDEVKQHFLSAHNELKRRKSNAKRARQWIAEYGALIDGLLRQVYQIAEGRLREEGVIPEELVPGLALLAIGGYGRNELCPQSDIDIAFVPAQENDPIADALIREAFRLVVDVLIDGAGIDVAYVYRPFPDMPRLDHVARVALCEARLIAGQEKLLRRVQNEVFRQWDKVHFLLNIARERTNIAKETALSLYAVEPNLKDGRGALRDIHAMEWIVSAILQTNNPLYEQEWRGLVTSSQAKQIEEARSFFLKIRVWLHLETQKKGNILRVQYQNNCAHALGYKGEGAVAAQALLRDYYGHAEQVARCVDDVMRRLLRGPLPLQQHFVAESKHLRAAHPYVLQNHPELLLSPFRLAQKYGFDFTDDLEEQIAAAVPLMDEVARGHPIVRSSFASILKEPVSCTKSLRAMRKRGVLRAIIPEFAAMLHLAPADPSHQLTVGEHSINTVAQLAQLWKNRHNDEELWNIWNDIDDIKVLLLAALLHDVGKIDPARDHCVVGEEISLEITQRLQWDYEQCTQVSRLVRWHLLLPRLSRLRDLTAPATLREVTNHISEISTLKMLYLLSIADTKAVGEHTYSRLDLQNMKELYERALLAMAQRKTEQNLSDSEKREQIAVRQRQRLHREMRRSLKDRIDEKTLLRLCEQLPTAYVLNTSLPTVMSHLQLIDQLPQEQLLIDWRRTEGNPATEVTVITYDEPLPGLLSKICGVVHAIGAEILAANVHTLQPKTGKINKGDIVLDKLQIGVRGRALPETQCIRFANKLRSVLQGKQSLEKVLLEAKKPLNFPIIPHRLHARNDLSDEYTVITVVCESIPGLMFWITRAMATLNIDIHTAKVATWAGRAEDVFYVTRRAIDDFSENGNSKIAEEDLPHILNALREELSRK